MQRRRHGFTWAQKRELWQRWKRGESLSDIGRALGKHAATIYGVVLANGGFVPPSRRRSERSLAVAEREEISRGLPPDYLFAGLLKDLVELLLP